MRWVSTRDPKNCVLTLSRTFCVTWTRVLRYALRGTGVFYSYEWTSWDTRGIWAGRADAAWCHNYIDICYERAHTGESRMREVKCPTRGSSDCSGASIDRYTHSGIESSK